MNTHHHQQQRAAPKLHFASLSAGFQWPQTTICPHSVRHFCKWSCTELIFFCVLFALAFFSFTGRAGPWQPHIVKQISVALKLKFWNWNKWNTLKTAIYGYNEMIVVAVSNCPSSAIIKDHFPQPIIAFKRLDACVLCSLNFFGWTNEYVFILTWRQANKICFPFSLPKNRFSRWFFLEQRTVAATMAERDAERGEEGVFALSFSYAADEWTCSQ